LSTVVLTLVKGLEKSEYTSFANPALPYQSVDSALYYLITSIVFAIAQYQGEVMKVAAANKGKSGMA
jgi:hypothetical protein